MAHVIMRTFIAIDLDSSTKKTLANLIQKLDKGQKKIRWIKSKGMHLTLKFLGNISEKDIETIKSLLEKVTKEHFHFKLTFHGIGTFPTRSQSPRVIWVGITDHPALSTFHKNLERELDKIGFPPEKRSFRPHLTLARIKKPCNLGTTLEEIHKIKDQGFGDMNVRTVTFFQSILKPSGAEYSIISEHYLQ